jgi:uncharacterized protein
MELKRFSEPAEFLALVLPELEQAEAANNLMLGLALRLVNAPQRFQVLPYIWPPFLAAVLDDSGLAAAALMTPPFNLIVFSPRASAGEAWEPLARRLLADALPPPGVLGPSTHSLAFAETWSRLNGVPFRPGMSERVYELRQVIQPPAPGGFLRLALPADEPLLAQWAYDFSLEALPDEPHHLEEARQMASFKVRDGDFFVWEDGGQVVSLAGKTRPMPHGIVIGPVYTPPGLRGRGYASAVTAGLSQHLLDSGYQFVALFTNLANPVSNSIYMKIGYRPICDFNEYKFGE